MPTLAVVHYHTPELAVQSVAALGEAVRTWGGEAEIVIVDNGSDADGRMVLAATGAHILRPAENLGYAGAINHAVSATEGDPVLVLNADVMVEPDCLSRLLSALESCDIAGPRFYWDGSWRLMMPPSDRQSRLDELLRVLSLRSAGWARRARQRWRRHARLHWRAREPLESTALSGALLAFRRAAFERLGGFDQGFQLYFEDTDFLLRAGRQGMRCLYVPAARAVHLYDQSAASEPRSRAWFEASARRHRIKHYGGLFERWLRALESGRGSGLRAEAPWGRETAQPGEHQWFEVSPDPRGFPAVAELRVGEGAAAFELPADVAERFPGRDLWLRVVDERGEELSCTKLDV